MARKNDRLFSSLVLYSSFKHAFSYKLCYSIDKKADTNEKKEVKRIAEMKQMRTFVDENKRSFFLAIPPTPPHPLSTNKSSDKTTLYIFMYACTLI